VDYIEIEEVGKLWGMTPGSAKQALHGKYRGRVDVAYDSQPRGGVRAVYRRSDVELVAAERKGVGV
jgi:hypothetical protein